MLRLAVVLIVVSVASFVVGFVLFANAAGVAATPHAGRPHWRQAGRLAGGMAGRIPAYAEQSWRPSR
jgi:hypothetical protein